MLSTDFSKDLPIYVCMSVNCSEHRLIYFQKILSMRLWALCVQFRIILVNLIIGLGSASYFCGR